MKEEWINEQFSTINVGDPRLQKRAVNVAMGCAQRPEESLAGRFDEWADLKAAYRFFSNLKITHKALQQPHYTKVLEKARYVSINELVLFIQDGSELLFNSHPWTHGLGPTADSNGNGLLFHSCLVAKYHEGSDETEILGLGYQYDFLHKASKLGWKYVVRARHNRYVEIDGKKIRLFSWIRQQTAKCTSKLYVKAKGEEFAGEVKLEITWVKAKLFPPNNKKDAAEEEVTYIRAWCSARPELEWLLITNLPVNCEADALKIITIYRRRWLVEDYHKVLKTGFRIEDNQLKQASRILALFGMIGVVATQLLKIREACRLFPTMPVEENIPLRWITLVERYLKVKLETVKDFWYALARMGGFIGRKSDREPGWQTIWKGYKRLQDMLLGANLL